LTGEGLRWAFPSSALVNDCMSRNSINSLPALIMAATALAGSERRVVHLGWKISGTKDYLYCL
jgi:hypothetical protein